jgi:hypothetical protein
MVLVLMAMIIMLCISINVNHRHPPFLLFCSFKPTLHSNHYLQPPPFVQMKNKACIGLSVQL